MLLLAFQSIYITAFKSRLEFFKGIRFYTPKIKLDEGMN